MITAITIVIGIYLLIWALQPLLKGKEVYPSLKKEPMLSMEEQSQEEIRIFVEECKALETEQEEQDETMKVEIVNSKFDVSKIKEYIPDDTVKITRFAPKIWEEYIGQSNAKKIIQAFIQGTNKINAPFPHLILDGSAGYGKTTLVYLLKNYLKAEMIEHIASELTNIEQLVPILDKINSSNSKKIILFIDEIHNLSPQLIELLYPILQEGKINNKLIRPFTFIGATTEKGQLIKKWKPFIDRMKIHITLQNYNLEEIKTIIKQYKNKVFPDVEISEENYTILGKNSRLTPRKANRLIESFIYIGDINKTLEVYDIVDKERGLTRTDIKILKYLNDNDKVGMQGLCSYLDTSQANYLFQYEPYLIQLGLILRTPRGRAISNKGTLLLKELKK